MSKVKVQVTGAGNVKIVLDRVSALKLARIINWSDAIGEPDGVEAKVSCDEANVEELSWALHDAFVAEGINHEDI